MLRPPSWVCDENIVPQVEQKEATVMASSWKKFIKKSELRRKQLTVATALSLNRLAAD